MGSKRFEKKETAVTNGNAVGTQVQQTLIVEDNVLPSAKELAAYKAINPDIVEHILQASKAEQHHRHDMDIQKIAVVRKSERSEFMINCFGMVFGFFSLMAVLALAGLALYLDHQWFAGVFATLGVSGIVSVFVTRGKDQEKQTTDKKQRDV